MFCYTMRIQNRAHAFNTDSYNSSKSNRNDSSINSSTSNSDHKGNDNRSTTSNDDGELLVGEIASGSHCYCMLRSLRATRKNTCSSGSAIGFTLPETNMETQKGPYKDYSSSKRGLYGFPC